jgi:hypothetical protein
MKREFLEEKWTEFALRVLPTASEITRGNMRAAFFAGAAILMREMAKISDRSAGRAPLPDDIDLLEDIQREIKNFVHVAPAAKARPN